ncbi:4889_t:CDS:1, partial [Rhizophagus irregularis]
NVHEEKTLCMVSMKGWRALHGSRSGLGVVVGDHSPMNLPSFLQ